jgi:site-specific DNA recombinase
LFGPERRAILEAQLAGVDDTAAREREAERERRTKLLGTIARQQESILRQARDGDPEDPFTHGLRQNYNELFEATRLGVRLHGRGGHHRYAAR